MGVQINASTAWKILVRLGYEMSYPTALKWLRENGLAQQTTGRYGTIMVDKDLLEKTIKLKKKVQIENRKLPGRKKEPETYVDRKEEDKDAT